MRRKKGRRTHRRSSTTCQPTSLAPSTRAGTEKDLAVERKKFNFQGALFLCSSSVTLFKFAPLCCLFARNSVSIVQIYFALAFEGKRVLNGLVCKYRNTCSNAKICVFCQIQRHLLLQCENSCILPRTQIQKYFVITWTMKSRNFFRWQSHSQGLPSMCSIWGSIGQSSSILFARMLQKAKTTNQSILQTKKGCSFLNISSVDVSLVVSKMCTFLKTLLK